MDDVGVQFAFELFVRVELPASVELVLQVAEDLLGSVVTSALQLFSQFAIIGGGLWAVWGVITLAGGLKDQNGPATQSGVWQVVGGGLIIAAAALFSNIAL